MVLSPDRMPPPPPYSSQASSHQIFSSLPSNRLRRFVADGPAARFFVTTTLASYVVRRLGGHGMRGPRLTRDLTPASPRVAALALVKARFAQKQRNSV